MAQRLLSTLLITLAVLSSSAATRPPVNNSNSAYPLMRLRLVLDAMNYDDIAIAFNPSATVQYNNQIDARYMPGAASPEGLSCYSADNVALSSYVVPLPQQQTIIRLDVEARNSGQFNMERTELDSISLQYDIWLVDNYKKDSVNLRTTTDYALSIDKNDTASFGLNRFKVVIRRHQAAMAQLLGFTAVKDGNSNQLNWTTANEQNTTTFNVERSIDEGVTFVELDSLRSNNTGSYSYTDKSPLSGTDAYRVKIKDVTGVTTYSDVVSIGEDSNGGNTVAVVKSNNLNIYPNPVSGVINITVKQNSANTNIPGLESLNSSARNFSAALVVANASYEIKIVNIKGTVVKTANTSSASWQDNVGELAPGTYIVQVINNKDNSVAGKSTFIKM